MEALRFHSPLLLILAPAAMVALWRAFHPKRQPAVLYSSIADLKSLPVTLAQRIRRIIPAVYAVGLLLLIAALARPQMGKSESRIHTHGIAIEMAIDVSGSMKAVDFELDGRQSSRLEAVKHVISEFVSGNPKRKLSGRRSDAVGLVAFGGFADSKCPLTLDHGALLDIVKALQVPKAVYDRRGQLVNAQSLQEELATAIGDGLALAVDRLKSLNAKSKVLILLTDGDNNAGVIEPLDAANLAKALGIRVYTIGVGQNGIAPVPIEDEFGQTFLQRQRFRIDEELLKEIATIGGGKYFNATNTEALAGVYAEIDKLEKSKVEETKYTEYTELYHWLAIPGLAMVLLAACLLNTRFRSLP